MWINTPLIWRTQFSCSSFKKEKKNSKCLDKTDETSTSGKFKLLFIEVEDEEAINSVNDKVTLGVGGWRRGVGGRPCAAGI